MKILTQEEEQAHNRATWTGGIIGSVGGLVIGGLGIYVASQRFPAFRSLSLPFRAFLLTSTTTFSGVIAADRYSRAFEKSRHADADYRNQRESEYQEVESSLPLGQRIKTFVSEQRYPIVFGSWVVSMGIALGLVGRHPTLTTQQKLVQARVYAQGLTLAVLIASFALEGNDLRAGKGRWETIKVVDPNDPEHKRLIEKQIHHESYQGEDQWMDMIDSEERKMKQRGRSVRAGEHKQGSKDEKQSSQQTNKDSSEQSNKGSFEQKNKDSSEQKSNGSSEQKSKGSSEQKQKSSDSKS